MNFKYYSNFLKKVYCRTNNIVILKALYNLIIISVKNKTTLSQKLEPNTKSIEYCKHFFNSNIVVSKLSKKPLRICLQYKRDFLIIHKNKPAHFIGAASNYLKLHYLARFYVSQYLKIILLLQNLCPLLNIYSFIYVKIVDLLKLFQN